MSRESGTISDEGIDIDFDLLSSFSMVNVALASDPEIVEVLERRVNNVENSRSVDLREAMSREDNMPQVEQSVTEAVRAIQCEMGLHRV